MNNPKKQRQAYNLFLMMIFCFISFHMVGCDRQSAHPTSDSGTGTNLRREADFIFIAAVGPNTLDPQKMSWNHDIRTAGCLYEPLVRYKLPEMTLEPAVARDWEISKDKRTYTFHLRPEAQWSNGDPVLASDFVTAWRRAMTPDFAADYVQLMFCIQGAQEFFAWRTRQLASFKTSDNPRQKWQEAQQYFDRTVGLNAPDDHTLIVKLARPTAYFLELCAFATFMPNHTTRVNKALQYDPDSGLIKLPPNFWSDPKRLLTNGPYVLKRYRFKRDLLFEQNPHWWNRRSMRNHSILQKIIDNPQTALMTYQNHQADWLPDIPSTLSLAADLLASGRSDVHRVPWAGTYFYTFNCLEKLPNGKPNPLADPRVRRALSMGIDRKTLVEKVTRMKQPQAMSFIPPKMIPNYVPPTQQGIVFDPVAARKLLTQAGYADPGTLKGLSILFNTGGGHEPVAQAVAAMWKKNLGVHVYLQAMETRAFRQKLKTQHYTIARASWIGDYRDPTTFLDKYHSRNGNNDARWHHQGYDQLLTKAQQQTDLAQRMQILERAEAILLQQQPIAPIYHYLTLHIYDPKQVVGLFPNAWNFRRLEQVQILNPTADHE